MAVSLTTITGPVYLPNGATPIGGRVSFELSSWDQEEGEALIISGPVYSTIDENGQFSVELYTSTAGVNSVHYRMFVIWEDSQLSESYVNDIYVGTPTPHYTKKYIGSFALSGLGPFQVSDLNIVSETNNSSFDAYLEMKAFADRIDLGEFDDAVAATVASAAQTALNEATSSANASATAADVVQTGLDRSAASGSASEAAASAGAASTSAGNAATSEANAAGSASSASTSASTATTQAGNASASATNAATSETNAGASASAAAASAASAAISEANAATSASNAATSESNASTSATAAAAARDLAYVNANVYASTAAGLAAVAVGGQFSVISGVDLVRYRVDAGPVATEVLRMSLNDASELIPIMTSSTTAPYIPNFDRASQVLTLYADTILFIRAAPQEYVVPTTINIDTTNGGTLVTSARRVYFRSSDNTFVVRAWNTDMTYTDVATHHLVAVIRHVTTPTTPQATRVTMTCPVTVDNITDPIQQAVLCPIILSGLAGYLPNLDTAANTLYIPGDIVIKAAGPLGNKAASYAVATGATIVLSTAASTAKCVYRSISGSSYVVKDHSAAFTGVEAADLLLVAVVRRSGSTGNYLTMNCACTVDGMAQLAGLDEKQIRWAEIYTPLGGTPKPTTNLPAYNSTTKTLTFYQDTIFVSRNDRWTVGVGGVSITLSGSSAIRVFWDTSTSSLVFKTWSTNLTKLEAAKYVLVAAIRDGSAAFVPPVISMMCPYTVDGKLLGYIPEYATSGAENRQDAAIQGIWHRGGSSYAPENTLAAYKNAAAANNYLVEGDIQWTSDDVAVLLHDSTIDRTSDGTGAIAGMTLATAKTYDFGSWKDAAFTGETIPTWDEYLILAKKLDLHGRFEIKTDATLAQVQGLLSSIKKAGMQGRIQLDSFYVTALQKVVAEEPTQDIGYLVGNLDGPTWTAAVASAVTNFQTGSNRVSIEPGMPNLTKAKVEEAHEAGLRVVVYTINSTADVATLADMGVDGIMTDALNIAQVIRDNEL